MKELIMEAASKNQDKIEQKPNEYDKNSGITEAVSKKRGRPTKFSENFRLATILFPEIKSERGKNDLMYRFHAISILKNDPNFFWLIDEEKSQIGSFIDKNVWLKPSILSELGRIGNPEHIKAIALQICEMKPKTKEAISIIRQWRLGKKYHQFNELELQNKIIKCIENYILSYPIDETLAWNQIINVLSNVQDMFESLKNENIEAQNDKG